MAIPGFAAAMQSRAQRSACTPCTTGNPARVRRASIRSIWIGLLSPDRAANHCRIRLREGSRRNMPVHQRLTPSCSFNGPKSKRERGGGQESRAAASDFCWAAEAPRKTDDRRGNRRGSPSLACRQRLAPSANGISLSGRSHQCRTFEYITGRRPLKMNVRISDP